MQRADDAVDYEALRHGLRAALVADALDGLGLRSQCLSGGIAPLVSGTVLVGRAVPVTVVRVESPPERPYRGLVRALDALGPDDVFVISSGGRPDVALWGELLSTAALAPGAAGAVCDGFVRGVSLVPEAGLRVFARGAVPYDINGRLEVLSIGAPVVDESITVTSGDLLVGDDDGVVIVPAIVRDAVIAHARRKAGIESELREAVSTGTLPSEAYDRCGVL